MVILDKYQERVIGNRPDIITPATCLVKEVRC